MSKILSIVAKPFTGLPPDASPRLRALQRCQSAIAPLSLLATLITLIWPQKYKLFTLSLLFSPLLTSITTVYFVLHEQQRAAAGTLSKQKYVKYQLLKMVAAFGMAVVAFIAHLACVPHVGHEGGRHDGERGLWINGVRINMWQGSLMWLSLFNWVFLWAGLFYSCCMTDRKQGAIALAGEEAQIGIDAEAGDEEANARV